MFWCEEVLVMKVEELYEFDDEVNFVLVMYDV